MKAKRTTVRRHGSGRLPRQPEDKAVRNADLNRQVKSFLAVQIKELRGELSQEAFGKLIGKPQSVISRLEDPEYGQVTLQTLLAIAAKLDVALIVGFASYPTYAKVIDKFASESLQPSNAD